MSDFQFDNQQPGAFGTPPQQFAAPPQKKSNTGRNLFLVCGCLLGITVVCCLLCVGSAFAAFQQPEFVVGYWSGTMQSSNDYAAVDIAICENSQAQTFTDTWKSQLVDVQELTITDTNRSDGILASGTIIRNGRVENWSANFFVEDGGTFGKCIDRIIVEQ